MNTLCKTFLIFLIASNATCHAVVIGFFPGLDKAVEQAEAIAIIRIDEHIQPRQNANLLTRHRCYVYQSLKGDLKLGQSLPLDLIDTRTSFVSSFPLNSTHLVFLTKTGASYQNLHFEGSILRLSPFGNEKLPEAETTEAKIRVLLKRSIDYWDSEWQKERKFLTSVAAKPKDFRAKEIDAIWPELWKSGDPKIIKVPKVAKLSEQHVIEQMAGKWTVMFGVTPDRLTISLSTNRLVEVSGQKNGVAWKKSGEWRVISDKLVFLLEEDDFPNFIFLTEEKIFIFDPWAKTMMSELTREK